MEKADREAVQMRILLEFREVHEKRQTLEAGIRALEGRSKLHIDQAALRDIELHRRLYLPPRHD
jgi:hypothetical protein